MPYIKFTSYFRPSKSN